MAQFRRPASLSPQQQDAIEGGVNPAIRNDAAHHSAAALLRDTRAQVDPQIVERVLRLVDNEGLDDLAELWSTAEPVSLPGALWRLYLLHTWVQRDTSTIKERFELGRRSAPGLTYLAGFADPPTIDGMRTTLDEILRGAFTGDLAIALHRAAAIAKLVAYGTAHLADSLEHARPDAVGHESANGSTLTAYATRLLTLGEDVEAAARIAEKGALE